MSSANGEIADLVGAVRYYVTSHSMLDDVRRVGIAVSGGSDSIALLHVFSAICRDCGVTPVVISFDHAIPGEHSDEDVVFVQAEADRLGLEFYTDAGNNIVARDGKSLEMVAREARRDFFRRMARVHDLDAIATGHQANDVAETLLMRLMRGAGATGLSGLRPVAQLPTDENSGSRSLRIIRPFLDIERETLRSWLRASNLIWREDPSNVNESIRRNRVRRTILPALAANGDGMCKTVRQLVQSAEILRSEDEYLDSVASTWIKDNVREQGLLPFDKMKAELSLPVSRRVLRKWFFSNCQDVVSGFAEVERVLNMSDGATTTLVGGCRITLVEGYLRIAAEVAISCLPDTVLPVPGRIEWGGFFITAEYVDAVVRSHGTVGEWPAECTISEKVMSGRSIIVRQRRDGDRIRPYGMRGSKKLQDVFTDAKLPRCQRDSYPVVSTGEDIIWIPGYRIAEGFHVQPGARAIRIYVGKL